MATGLEQTAANPMTGRPAQVLQSRQGAFNTASDPLQTLLRQASEFEAYTALVDYLAARRMMPTIKQRPMGNMSGSFQTNSFFGNNLPKTGVVNVGLRAGPGTVIHELTHAANRQIELQYFELKNKRGDLTEAEKKFMQAYEKLAYDQFGRDKALPRRVLAEKLDPTWAKKEEEYRATNEELPAWGMEFTVEPDRSYNQPLHLDPTLATEFRILMDLARKAQPVIPGR